MNAKREKKSAATQTERRFGSAGRNDARVAARPEASDAPNVARRTSDSRLATRVA
jgi:hypothetical protein